MKKYIFWDWFKPKIKSREELIEDKAFYILDNIDMDQDDFSHIEEAQIIVSLIKRFKQRKKQIRREHQLEASNLLTSTKMIN